MKQIFTICVAFGVAVSMTSTVRAESFSVDVPSDQLTCLIENQDAYLTIPRPIISFFTQLCPATSGEEAETLAQNSADPGETVLDPVLMTKGDFQCLLEKIDVHLSDSNAEPEADTETETETETENEVQDDEVSILTFVLDCEV